MIPDASFVVAIPGYSHLHDDDKPWVGIEGLAPGQSLWRTFYIEQVRRAVWRYMRTNHPVGREVMKRRLETYDSLPKDR